MLVGTISIEKVGAYRRHAPKRGIKDFNVLNAKHHEKEAQIIAQAGRLGAITIATNMAGRGTDIILGGNPEFEAKKEMAANGYDEDAIAFATSFVQSDDAELLQARKGSRSFSNSSRKSDGGAGKVVSSAAFYRRY